MVECPICGLGERCRNHWVAVQEPNGEIEFQIGPMTASEDNLILLRNKLKNPPLRQLFDAMALSPSWVEAAAAPAGTGQGRLLAYLAWPLELRGAVHRSLFPNGAPGAGPPPPPPAMQRHRLEDLELEAVELDLTNCLPDELLYWARFRLRLAEVGDVRFSYMQLLWAEGVEWARLLQAPPLRLQVQALVRLLFGGLLDPLRAAFAGREVQVLAEDADGRPATLTPGADVDEVATVPGPGEREMHLGEEIEMLINHRRLQPLLREQILASASR
jgi:hypothetical protein